MMESKWFLERSIIDNLGKGKVVRGELWTFFSCNSLSLLSAGCLSVCLSVSLFVCLSVKVRCRLGTNLSCNRLLPAGCLSVSPYVCLSVCVSVCLSICLSVQGQDCGQLFLAILFLFCPRVFGCRPRNQ